MSTINKTAIDPTIEFCESIRKRVVKLSERADSSASALADAAIAAQTPLRCERDLRKLRDARTGPDALADSWSRRAAETFDLAESLVDKVESQDERDYLVRILIDSVVRFIPPESELWAKALAILEKTADSDERQLATFALAIGAAKRLPYLSKVDAQSVLTMTKLIDSLEDDDDCERASGIGVAATRAAFERNRADKSEAQIQAEYDKALDAFFIVATIDGVVRYFNETALEFIDAFPVSRVEPFLTHTWSGLREALDRVERGVQTRVLRERVEEGWEDGDLDDEDVDELKDLLKTLEITNPIATNFGEETRAFVERSDAFGTIEKQLARVGEALGDALDPVAKTIYTKDRAYYKSERDAWLELAEKTARVDALLPREKASRLTRLANMQFKFGEKERGRAAVLEVLALLPQLESAGYAESCLEALVQIHVDCRQTKPAKRLAELLDEKIAAQTEPAARDYRLAKAFDLYLRVFDDARLEEALNSFTSSVYQTTWRAKSLVARAFSRFRESNDAEALRSELDSAAAYLAESQEQEDPVLAASALRDLAEFAAEQAR